ncbi:unnamed protein product [Leptidea sinapis]|uniref:Uncharacterized protein n=1 Tax=Leptidea sinapis TaxID=189913 RepID=A0A5E4Q3P5_9NEOP|nr:unnamed protein product [Leptidea sinapis]
MDLLIGNARTVTQQMRVLWDYFINESNGVWCQRFTIDTARGGVIIYDKQEVKVKYTLLAFILTLENTGLRKLRQINKPFQRSRVSNIVDKQSECKIFVMSSCVVEEGREEGGGFVSEAGCSSDVVERPRRETLFFRIELLSKIPCKVKKLGNEPKKNKSLLLFLFLHERETKRVVLREQHQMSVIANGFLVSLSKQLRATNITTLNNILRLQMLNHLHVSIHPKINLNKKGSSIAVDNNSQMNLLTPSSVILLGEKRQGWNSIAKKYLNEFSRYETLFSCFGDI